MSIDRRVLILGASGAGKSTLARIIGDRCGLPVVHLDKLYWQPGWRPPEPKQFRDRVATAAYGPRWVIDGNYASTMDLRLPRATTVIWLDLPRRVYFPRTVWRFLLNWRGQRADVGPECPERFDLGFFRDWVWGYPRHSRERHRALLAGLSPPTIAIRLASRGDVRRFIAALPHALDETA